MIPWLDPRAGRDAFPDPRQALPRPNGLLAAGGDLHPDRLLAAYRRGIFPWYESGQPILWWSPEPRAVLYPGEVRVSRSLRKSIRREGFEVSRDQAFGQVIRACADRGPDTGTWITPEMAAAYDRLFHRHAAHSVEIWQAGRLVGGLYGVAIGRVFFGESMFSRVTDASKAALAHLAGYLERSGFGLIDCQIASPHLRSLGSREIPRDEFLQILERLCAMPPQSASWPLATEPLRLAH